MCVKSQQTLSEWSSRKKPTGNYLMQRLLKNCMALRSYIPPDFMFLNWYVILLFPLSFLFTIGCYNKIQRFITLNTLSTCMYPFKWLSGCIKLLKFFFEEALKVRYINWPFVDRRGWYKIRTLPSFWKRNYVLKVSSCACHIPIGGITKMIFLKQ